jgi:hypothetical protein
MARREPVNSSRTSRYCSACNVYWPATVDYRTCGECGGETYGVIGHEPIARAEAERRVNLAAFERHYAAHEARRISAGEPTPEEKGAEEARTLIDLEKRATAPE